MKHGIWLYTLLNTHLYLHHNTYNVVLRYHKNDILYMILEVLIHQNLKAQKNPTFLKIQLQISYILLQLK